MKNTKKLIIILLTVLVVVGCKKYPENDRIYLSSFNKRLTDKVWELDYIVGDTLGIFDIPNSYPNYLMESIEFKKNGDLLINSRYFGKWETEEKKMIIRIDSTDGHQNLYFSKYRIKQLTKNTISLGSQHTGGTFYFKLK